MAVGGHLVGLDLYPDHRFTVATLLFSGFIILPSMNVSISGSDLTVECEEA